jgi:prepilin-type N-terminal cleavage/methylation domain-containing protein
MHNLKYMIHSKHLKKGFTLIEVIISIAVIGMVLSPLFILQGNVLQRVTAAAHRIHRLFFAQDFYLKAQRKQDEKTRKFTLEERQDFPPTLLTYDLGSLHKNSALADLPGLLMEKITIFDHPKKGRPSDMLLTFIYKPEVTEKK